VDQGTPVRQARGQERVEQILRATLDVVARDGVAAVTHRSVAEAAGVPLGSLTYYFASKQELLRDALLLHVAEDTARLRTLATQLIESGAQGDEVVVAFAELLEAHGDIAQFELYIEAARDPALRDAAVQSLKAYERTAVLGLRAAGVPDPEGSAHLVVAAIDGLGIHRRAAGDADRPELRTSLARLLRALVAAG
jgi:DNA-binding transcriptional regulator YbjK